MEALHGGAVLVEGREGGGMLDMDGIEGEVWVRMVREASDESLHFGASHGVDS